MKLIIVGFKGTNRCHYSASIIKRCDESLMVALEAMNFVCSVYYISCKHVRATRPYD